MKNQGRTMVTFNEESNDVLGFDLEPQYQGHLKSDLNLLDVLCYCSLTSVQPIEVTLNSDLNAYLNVKFPAIFDCGIKNVDCHHKNKVDPQMTLILRFKVKSKVTIGLLVESYHRFNGAYQFISSLSAYTMPFYASSTAASSCLSLCCLRAIWVSFIASRPFFSDGADLSLSRLQQLKQFETKCYFKLVKMSYLTESLKIEILMMIGYDDRARTQCEVVRLFRETHPDLPPLNQGTISKIEAQYREMGHVRKVPSKRQAVVDDDTKLNLLLALEENPITPARQLARDSNLNHKTVLIQNLHSETQQHSRSAGKDKRKSEK
ncbi:hypothetical protein NQ318_014729 [Aromia moschata]|uniref:DUF4817 domain-containing protein n=1 Tax=Aromia moschata TaxID=1265417 RepID=A0AAV8ZBG7_9CUCU|nr:hypothetical protein NQ318_014729 [Aromia moschata]